MIRLDEEGRFFGATGVNEDFEKMAALCSHLTREVMSLPIQVWNSDQRWATMRDSLHTISLECHRMTAFIKYFTPIADMVPVLEQDNMAEVMWGLVLGSDVNE